MDLTLLDGPLGTELNARGVETDLPWWSASAIDTAPETILEIHREYAQSGATIHTANTFRTRRRTVGAVWERMAREAVRLAKKAVGSGTVAGSIAPLEDCYRPDLSPRDPGPEHVELAEVLADAGCDLLICETFPHVGEAVIAVESSAATGLPTWVSFTAGPEADLLSPEELVTGAKRAVDAGVQAVLVNCVPAVDTHRFVRALADANLGVPFGAYANAGSVDERIGWKSPDESATEAYLEYVQSWVDDGATLVGGCCGTGPAHIAAIYRNLVLGEPG